MPTWTIPSFRSKRTACRATGWRACWPAGPGEAQRRLSTFLAERAPRYHNDRDLPALDGTSTLSPYLSVGSISARQCLAAARDANSGQLTSGNRGIAAWINELIWRDFYRHVIAQFPRVNRGRAFRRSFDQLEWRDSSDDLEAWKQGRTGFPLVDAGMRQLAATGWMHNRLRMLTAMFLSKHLLLDWRQGEWHFMNLLVDGDFAANNGGWQWSASTGTDAVPYFRIFNPHAQARRFDPDGRFIRRYVARAGKRSDLAHCSTRRAATPPAIHRPSSITAPRATGRPPPTGQLRDRGEGGAGACWRGATSRAGSGANGDAAWAWGAGALIWAWRAMLTATAGIAFSQPSRGLFTPRPPRLMTWV